MGEFNRRDAVCRLPPFTSTSGAWRGHPELGPGKSPEFPFSSNTGASLWSPDSPGQRKAVKSVLPPLCAVSDPLCPPHEHSDWRSSRNSLAYWPARDPAAQRQPEAVSDKPGSPAAMASYFDEHDCEPLNPEREARNNMLLELARRVRGAWSWAPGSRFLGWALAERAGNQGGGMTNVEC